MFKDIETGEILTLDDLKNEYNELKAAGEIETNTFYDYLVNITDKNGTIIYI